MEFLTSPPQIIVLFHLIAALKRELLQRGKCDNSAKFCKENNSVAAAGAATPPTYPEA